MSGTAGTLVPWWVTTCSSMGLGPSISRAVRARSTPATIAAQQVRFDATLLKKSAAYANARAAGKVRLYKMATWLHLKYVIPRVSASGYRIFMIAGHPQTSGHRDAIRRAVDDVCQQNAFDRTVVPCILEAQSSGGIQSAERGAPSRPPGTT